MLLCMKCFRSKFVLATISHSWFQVPGSAGVCVPQTGTRPGDPLADLLFAFAMSRILEETYAELFRVDCLNLHEDAPMGTTWADDTCVFLSGEATTIDARSATAFSIIHAVLQRHGMTPTYGQGKTAVLINYRGRQSARHHKRRYSMASPVLPVVVEHGCSVYLNVVLHYKHLGSIVDSDTLLPEIKTRSAVALQAVKPLVKQCLASEKIGLPRRQQILASLGLSVLLHNVGTWRRLNEQEFGAWHAAVWKLYSCMYRSEPTEDFSRRTIDHVSLKAGSFTPSALLHVARLRLLTNLLRAPDDLLPFAIEDNFRACGEDSSKSWFGSVLVALDWLKATVGDFPSYAVLRSLRPRELVFPHADIAQDLALALRKAKRAHLLLVQMTVDLSDADHQIETILKGAGWICPELQCVKNAKGKYICPQCGAGFRGEAHLATHRQRAHGQLVAARRYVTGTTCRACKKNFHTRPRVIKHLQYQSSRCLPWLILNSDPISADFARDLDARDAEMIGEERRTGTRSSATRMPVDDSEAAMPPVVTFLHSVPPSRVGLQGYEPLGVSRRGFLDSWRGAHEGPWVLDAAIWSTFAAVLKQEFDACPVANWRPSREEFVIWSKRLRGGKTTLSRCMWLRSNSMSSPATMSSSRWWGRHLPSFLKPDFVHLRMSLDHSQFGWGFVIPPLGTALEASGMMGHVNESWQPWRRNGEKRSISGSPALRSLTGPFIVSATTWSYSVAIAGKAI